MRRPRHPTPGGRPLNRAEFLVLAVLIDGPLHGYGVAKAIDDRTDGNVRIRPANLYRVLDRLADLGLLEESTSPQATEEDAATARGRERSRYFAVTTSGRAAAQREADVLRSLIESSPSLSPATQSQGGR